MICSYFAYSFFFFQAEDGIRDYKVTGVQTCALPISSRACPTRVKDSTTSTTHTPGGTMNHQAPVVIAPTLRSEERRVGKEGRSRGARWRGKTRTDKEQRTTKQS